jgi:hypothetical protein
MTRPYLTDRLTQGVRTQFANMMAHTYDRVPVTRGARNDWSETPMTPGAPVVGRPCRYMHRASIEITPEGFAVVKSPPTRGAVIYREVLLLPWDDTLAVDDLVQNIRDLDGAVLLVGPVPVVEALPRSGLGPTTNRVAVLRGPTDELPPQ